MGAVIKVLIIFVCNALILVCSYGYNNTSTLELVHVLFRHGNRTIDPDSTFPNDPYVNETYHPYGHRQLTNKGKQKAYRLGKALRTRYENFLGHMYSPDLLEAVSTNLQRAKMSMELVLAGLFPPKNTPLEWEKKLNWQPIPYEALKFSSSNHLLSFALDCCPLYTVLHHEYLSSPRGREIYIKHKKLFQSLTQKTGKLVNSTLDVSNIHDCFVAEKDWGFKLPSWVEKEHMKDIQRATIDDYLLSSATGLLKQLSGGFLLKKIINDTQLKINDELFPRNRKMFLYSAHDFSVGYLLNAMEVFFPHLPPYSACVLIEIHQIDGVHGVKIFYQDYAQDEPKMLTVPGCRSFCPFQSFVKLLQKNLPENDDACATTLTVSDDNANGRINWCA